jgi:hypothetical protein
LTHQSLFVTLLTGPGFAVVRRFLFLAATVCATAVAAERTNAQATSSENWDHNLPAVQAPAGSPARSDTESARDQAPLRSTIIEGEQRQTTSAEERRAQQLESWKFYCGGSTALMPCVDQIIAVSTEIKKRDAHFRKTGEGYNAGLSLTGCYSYCVATHFPTDTPDQCTRSISTFRSVSAKKPSLRDTDLRALLAEECALTSSMLDVTPGHLHRAAAVIKRHRLLTPDELACSSIEEDGSSKTTIRVNVREKHNIVCGGDADTAPRRFTLEIDRQSGKARWDRNSEMELRPIPSAPLSQAMKAKVPR